MKILVANPTGNITVFVLEPLENPLDRAEIAKLILSDPRLKAEQMGFVFPPSSSDPHSKERLWHLEMAGSEFCCNAVRSFGLYIARLQEIKGKVTISVSTSGSLKPVEVFADIENSKAKAQMPKPLFIETIDIKGQSLLLVVFEGISHVIAPDFKADDKLFYEIKKLAEEKIHSLGKQLTSAFGVMFYDTQKKYLKPAVYLNATDSLVFESSCGSGSAALGIWLSQKNNTDDGTELFKIKQPGGIIEAEINKKNKELQSILIGGKIELYNPIDMI